MIRQQLVPTVEIGSNDPSEVAMSRSVACHLVLESIIFQCFKMFDDMMGRRTREKQAGDCLIVQVSQIRILGDIKWVVPFDQGRRILLLNIIPQGKRAKLGPCHPCIQRLIGVVLSTQQECGTWYVNSGTEISCHVQERVDNVEPIQQPGARISLIQHKIYLVVKILTHAQTR
jgi:hypothetical protein